MSPTKTIRPFGRISSGVRREKTRPVTIYRIPSELVFPHPSQAEPSGLLGVGGDLQPNRLLLSYASGIFPWYNEEQPILWFSPDPRFVLYPAELYVGRSLQKVLRQHRFRITLDTAFDAVIQACSFVPRPGQTGTWITTDMMTAYQRLHQLGHAHSVEIWQDQALVGGLYGVAIGRLFAGESMFSTVSNASKVALVALVRQLHRWGFGLIDSQVHTDTLERMGANEIPRPQYLNALPALVGKPHMVHRWRLDDDFDPALEVLTSLP
jgi:leucyl/phenylalanyl-tRNA--protein transferase